MRILSHPGIPELTRSQRSRLAALARDTLAAHPVGGSVHLVLTDDAHMRHLNATYRGKGRTTDVLSFDLRGGSAGFPAVHEKVAGEIYISLPQAQVQAAQQQVSLLAELGRLFVHGLLHLAGYDHDTSATLRAMERETDRFLLKADLLNGPKAP